MSRCFRSLMMAGALLIAAPALAEEKPLTKSDVEAIVKDYIANNPKEIFLSLQNAEAKMRAEEGEKQKQNLASRQKELTQDPDSPVIGNPKGDATLVEFFDYNCGYCKRMIPVLQELVKNDKNVRIVLKDFPILHPTSQLAAKAGLAVARIDKSKTMDFHTEMLKHNGQLSEDVILEAVKKIGVDVEKVKAEMKKPELETILRKNLDLGAAIGIQGTPAFVVGNDVIPGATTLKDLEDLLRKSREGKKS